MRASLHGADAGSASFRERGFCPATTALPTVEICARQWRRFFAVCLLVWMMRSAWAGKLRQLLLPLFALRTEVQNAKCKRQSAN
jgi:hypothetical protein